jgi:cyclase
MDADGEKSGFNIPLTKQIAERLDIPVIASGGAGSKADFYPALVDGRADAALAASIFHFRETSVTEVKETLRQKGVPVRWPI